MRPQVLQRRSRRAAAAVVAADEVLVVLDGSAAVKAHDWGGYSGPLSYRQGRPMRPDVAAASDRMAAAARGEAGLALLVVSGYEQRLARKPAAAGSAARSRPGGGRMAVGWRGAAMVVVGGRDHKA